MNPNMQDVMSSYLKIKKLVGDEENNFLEDEEEEEEKERYATEERADEANFKLKKKKLNLGEGSGQSTGHRIGGGGGVDVAAPPRCLVENCEADLSGCKKYHQRHRVCEVHAKAAVAIVEGLRQRFCQQCSRFHGLSEFDQTKRSCRRRLAGHNERRRKKEVSTQKTEGKNQSFHIH
ncbi:hypothetical protein BUALT_Bualt03G0138700 [Buddleja alternifolia]|uniref:SBP-type domain-containing protein n=1 Tax=Buddleja alternifolia TaxID=168488 RepID=A0AAV6Y4V0_9LAMI|nr:hypothetical protein BUALT_Bualt03G0138700 [Buddleja alternifolia]